MKNILQKFYIGCFIFILLLVNYCASNVKKESNTVEDIEAYMVDSFKLLKEKRKIIEENVKALEDLKDKEEIIMTKIKNGQEKLRVQKSDVKSKIDKFMSLQEDKLKLPIFKQTNKDTIKLEKTMKTLKDFLPLLTDDDYFLDKKDPVVFTYLMKEDDKVKRINNIPLPELSQNINNEKSSIKIKNNSKNEDNLNALKNKLEENLKSSITNSNKTEEITKIEKQIIRKKEEIPAEDVSNIINDLLKDVNLNSTSNDSKPTPACIIEKYNKINNVTISEMKKESDKLLQGSIFDLPLDEEKETVPLVPIVVQKSCQHNDTIKYNITIAYVKNESLINYTRQEPNHQRGMSNFTLINTTIPLNITKPLNNTIPLNTTITVHNSTNILMSQNKITCHVCKRVKKNNTCLCKNPKLQQTATEIKKAISDNNKNTDMLIKIYLEKKRRMNQLNKKNTFDKKKFVPPLFDSNEIAKATNIRKKNIQPNYIKKHYESDDNKKSHHDELNSFLEKSPPKIIHSLNHNNENIKYNTELTNKILIDYPHYGKIGEQVIFNSIPDYTNKKYLGIK